MCFVSVCFRGHLVALAVAGLVLPLACSVPLYVLDQISLKIFVT